jgi:hypothetical protein
LTGGTAEFITNPAKLSKDGARGNIRVTAPAKFLPSSDFGATSRREKDLRAGVSKSTLK